MKRAVVLLSGGLDSATTLFVAREKGYRVTGLVFDYGQRHRREIVSARRIARRAGCACRVISISLPWKGSALLDKRVAVPTAKSDRRESRAESRGQQSRATNSIPVTYVPARNIIFLSYALSYAEATGAQAIFIGANSVDYSGYPDCRPPFYRAFARAAGAGTKCGVQGRPVKIETPLIRLTKAGIIRRGLKLGVPYELTWSCYQGGKAPCGVCDSCRLRAKGFGEAGFKDPALK